VSGTDGVSGSGSVRLPWQNSNRKLVKIKDQANVVCSRLGASLQQFAFSALQVFDSDGKFILTDSVFNNILLHPPGIDLCDVILNLGSAKRAKQIGGSCAVAVRRISAKDTTVLNRLDVSLSPYLKSNDNKYKQKQKQKIFFFSKFVLVFVQLQSLEFICVICSI
jgi:hypothetical protein